LTGRSERVQSVGDNSEQGQPRKVPPVPLKPVRKKGRETSVRLPKGEKGEVKGAKSEKGRVDQHWWGEEHLSFLFRKEYGILRGKKGGKKRGMRVTSRVPSP